ncbi:MAG: hypothetical protein ACYCY9_07575 [Thiobacillus sp.]
MAARVMLLALVLLASPWAAASLTDPTAPPVALSSAGRAGAPEEAGLAWVRVNGPHSIAWYGGTTVRLGDAVEGGRVTAIREDHIVISGRNGRRAVYLIDPSVRTQSPTPRRPAR